MLRVTLLLLSLAATASAQLRWENPVQQFHRAPEDREVETRFAFKNSGEKSVTIEKVRTSCGCTTATPNKKTYAPGESGEITAKFRFGSRTGPLRKTISVTTDDLPAQPTVLDLRVWVQDPITVQPALVFWRVGDPPEPKSVQLTAPGPAVRIKGITSTNPRVVATLQTVKEGSAYTVSIRPSETTQKEAAEFIVQTDFPPDAPRSYKIFARVK